MTIIAAIRRQARRRRGGTRIAAATLLLLIAAPGIASAQTRVPPWPLGLCLALAALLAGGLAAVLILQRQLSRNTDQFASVCGLLATLDRNARAAETRGTDALNLAAARLEAAITESETTFRDDGSTLRATVRYLETQGVTVADLVGRLETLAQFQPHPPAPPVGEVVQDAPPVAAPREVLARFDALARAQAGREAALDETLGILRGLAGQLPAEATASAARLDAALADSVARRLSLFETVGAAVTRLVERADAASGLARLDAMAARLDGAASAMAPLHEAVTRLETTAGLPPLLTRLIEQAQEAQSDLVAGIAASPGGADAQRPSLAEGLDALATLPPLVARLTEDAAAATNAATVAMTQIAAATTALAPLGEAVSRLESLKDLPAELDALSGTAAAAQASLADTIAGAATRLTETADTLAPLAGCAVHLDALARLPAQLSALAENAAGAQAGCECVAAAALEKLNSSLIRLENLTSLPADLERLAGSATAAQAELSGTVASASRHIAEASQLFAPFAETAAHAGTLTRVTERLSGLVGEADAAASMLAETAGRLAAGTEGSLAVLQLHTETLGATAVRLADAEPALAGLCATLAEMPDQLGATLAGFGRSQSAEQERMCAAWTRTHGETAAIIESLAARADAALSALPAEADLIAAMLDGAGRTEARLSDATTRLETIVDAPLPATAGLDAMLARFDAIIGRLQALPNTTETLDHVLAELRAATAALATPAAPPAWLPHLAELDLSLQETLASLRGQVPATESIERAAAALTAAATETMGHGYAQLHRMDTILSRAAQTPAEWQALPAMLGDLRTALASQQGVAEQVRLAASNAAAAAQAVREAATPPAGIAVIPSLAATCRSLAADLGALARGGTAPADLAACAPSLLAALQEGADDLRTAATALALARDALPDAA
jgi:hypothetical protein